MADEPNTATEMLMRMNSEEDHLARLLRSFAILALRENGLDERDTAAAKSAYRAAEMATEEVGRLLIETRRAYMQMSNMIAPVPFVMDPPSV